jgi:hypothetical protein
MYIQGRIEIQGWVGNSSSNGGSSMQQQLHPQVCLMCRETSGAAALLTAILYHTYSLTSPDTPHFPIVPLLLLLPQCCCLRWLV